MTITDHRKLQVWQKAMQLTEDIYSIVKQLPSTETYALSSQMRRAAISIPSNIAEGNARGTDNEKIRFLSIAQGSRAELETQVELSYRIGYISQEQMWQLTESISEVGKMLNGLISSIIYMRDNDKKASSNA